MKTKELISRLLELDPSGNTEVCIANLDINAIWPSEAYYDGRLERIVKDENGEIIGCKYVSRGIKINIDPISIEECLVDNPELPIDFSESDEYLVDSLKKKVERWREESRIINREIKTRLRQNDK